MYKQYDKTFIATSIEEMYINWIFLFQFFKSSWMGPCLYDFHFKEEKECGVFKISASNKPSIWHPCVSIHQKRPGQILLI